MKTWADLGIEAPSSFTDRVYTTCPQCSERRKNKRAKCLVAFEDGGFQCHHCGWSGNLRQGQRTGSEPGYGEPLRRKEWVRPRPIPRNPQDHAWAAVVAWFAERGIPEDVLRRNGIMATKAWMPEVETERSCIAFPYRRNGDLVNVKYRDAEKHFAMVKGAERCLYKLDDLVDQTVGIVVEGEIDALSLEVAGYPVAVSVPDGAPPTSASGYASKFAFLDDPVAVERLGALTTIVLACDADPPGEKLTEELARRLGKERCHVVTWPDGIKDANECLVQAGVDVLRACIEHAEPIPVEGIIEIPYLIDHVQRLYDEGLKPGERTGWLSLDRYYTVKPGLLTIVTGAPGTGKTVWLDNLLINLARSADWRFAVCSPEYRPLARHVAGLLSIYYGKPFGTGPTERMTWSEALAGADWLAERFFFIGPEEPTIDAILDRAKVLLLRKGVNGLIIDPYNEIEHRHPPHVPATTYTSQVLSQLLHFSGRYDVHTSLVAHPTKLKKNEATGEYPVPKPWDISGSSAFYDKADVNISLWRKMGERGSPLEVHVQKVKFPEVGEEGMVELWFDRATGRYWDRPPGAAVEDN